MDSPQIKTNQAKTSQEEYTAEQPTGLILTDLMTTPTAAPTDLNVSNKEGQIQSRPNMNVQTWQSQEEAMKNITATFEQNRNKYSVQQATEQTERPSACQPTLHSTDTTYYIDRRGNLEDGISVHGPRSQGPRTMLIVLTESTNSATRSPARQFCNKADT